MASESRPSVEVPCDHNFKRLHEEKGPDGQWVLCCSKCGKVRYVEPPQPVQESTDNKPLLME